MQVSTKHHKKEMTMEKIQELYVRWVQAKRAEEEAKAAEKDAEANVKATSEGKAWMLAKSIASNKTIELGEIDAQLRVAAIGAFRETGERQVHPRVELRMFKVYQYDDKIALPWVRDNLPVALAINKKVFEKVLGSMPAVPDCVEVIEDPRPYVSMPKEEGDA
jgi:hypothetical protein